VPSSSFATSLDTPVSSHPQPLVDVNVALGHTSGHFSLRPPVNADGRLSSARGCFLYASKLRTVS
jgi:hypothetical protein